MGKIATNVKAGNIKFYRVGHKKEVSLEDFEGTYTVRIANTSTPEECDREEFSQTACGFVIEFEDIITEHKMNSSETNKGGWPASKLYSYVNSTIYEALTEELKDNIIDTRVVSGYRNRAGETNFTSIDKLYLLSTKEIYGVSNDYDNLVSETRQLDYYKEQGVSTSNYSGAIKKCKRTADHWWLRSTRSASTGRFFVVTSTGGWSYGYAYDIYGVALAFRIG